MEFTLVCFPVPVFPRIHVKSRKTDTGIVIEPVRLRWILFLVLLIFRSQKEIIKALEIKLKVSVFNKLTQPSCMLGRN